MSKLLSKEEILQLPSIYDGTKPNTNYIYFLIHEDEIIYIGISKNVFARIGGHSKKMYNKILLLELPYKDVDLEGDYIYNFTPKYNKVLKSKNIIPIAAIHKFTGINNCNFNIKVIYGKMYVKRSDLEKFNIEICKGKKYTYFLKQK